MVDKIDKIGFDGMKQELGKGRLDSSGAEVKGLGLSAELVNGVVDFFKNLVKQKTP